MMDRTFVYYIIHGLLWSGTRLYARKENVEYEQLAEFVATTQLLVNYLHANENWRTL